MTELPFCPRCYAQIPFEAGICPSCGASLDDWHAKSYVERLILALGHPLADVRMRAIIALGLRREAAAANPLRDCALRHVTDVIEALEIVNSLPLIRGGGGDDALRALAARHPARAVRQAAERVLVEGPQSLR